MTDMTKLAEDAAKRIDAMSAKEFEKLVEDSGGIKPREKFFANPTSDYSEEMQIFVSRILKDNITLLSSKGFTREKIAELLGLGNPNMVSNLKKRTTYCVNRLLTFCFLCTKAKISGIRIPTFLEMVEVRFAELGLNIEDYFAVLKEKGWSVEEKEEYFKNFSLERDYLLCCFLMDLPGFWGSLNARLEQLNFQMECSLYPGGLSIDHVPGFMYLNKKD